MLEVIILEDQRESLNKLSQLVNKTIESHNLDAGIVYGSCNPYDVLNYAVTNVRPEQLYLIDILMSNQDTNGVEIAKRIREREKSLGQPRCCILFVSSASFKYSGLGYDVNAYNLIQKPFSNALFEEIFMDIYANEYLVKSPDRAKTAFFTVRSGPEIYNINISDVVCIERNKLTRKAHIVTDKFSIECREPLSYFDEIAKWTSLVRSSQSQFMNKKRSFPKI